jgi:hypothetical protein
MRYRWDPPYPASTHRSGPDDGSSLRASDAERNEVSERLSRHFADGRLDQAEFKTRLDRSMGAVTRGDLDGLFDDLPRLPDDPEPPRPRRRLLLPLVVLMILATAAVSAFYSTIHISWLIVVVVGIFLWRRAGRHRSSTHHELHR